MCGSVAWGGTVVLKDGGELRGEVKVASDRVFVESADGTVTVPLWRVTQIMRGEPAKESEAASGERGDVSRGRSPAAETHNPSNLSASRQEVGNVLSQKVTVDFHDVPFSEALLYVLETAGVNFAISSAVYSPEIPAVTLRLKEVELRHVLRLMLQPRGFNYRFEPGRVTHVARAAEVRQYTLSVYDVRDLLFNAEDKYSAGSAAQYRGYGAGSQRGVGNVSVRFGQFGRGYEGGSGTYEGGYGESGYGGYEGGSGRGGYGAEEEDMRSRTQSLTYLITQLCSPGTWAEFGVIGGAQAGGYGGQGAARGAYGGYEGAYGEGIGGGPPY